MKNLFLMASAVLLFSCPISAQFNTVNYDFERSWFNEGQPLPAEQSMIFKGNVPSNAEFVELNILSTKSTDLLYQSIWQKSTSSEMSLIVPFKLRASTAYDLELRFYKAADSNSKERLISDITEVLKTFIDVNLVDSKSLKFKLKSKRLLKAMNTLIADASKDFRTNDTSWNPTLSQMVALKLDQIKSSSLTESFDKKEENANKSKLRKEKRVMLINELKDQIGKEVQILFNKKMYLISVVKLIDNYETTSKANSIALNVGYGGAYISGDWDNLSYGASPYLGIAFPLGNSVLGSKFLSNSSITLGVFLNDFIDNNGNEITGFVVDRPFYVGLDHKFFKFIRMNAGATFLEQNTYSGGEIVNKEVMIRPFVGLSARIDLSIELGN